MNRPSIALSCIMKNEALNLSRFLQSNKGCFDEIVLVDTGSTDKTVEFVNEINKRIKEKDPDWEGFPIIKLFHFTWVNDFAKARQFSMDQCVSDYVCWQDLDDVLSDANAFIKWRDTVMHTAHLWLATYDYAFNDKGEVECQFIRERVVKNKFGFKWKYFIHEGLVAEEGKQIWPNKVNSWRIVHRRTEEDKKADHLRNIKIFESHDLSTLPSRMKYYYGKELLENGFPEKSGSFLFEAIKSKDLELHDRVLGMQYASQSALLAKAYDQSIGIAFDGLKISPMRAEFWCLIGDSYLHMGNIGNAIVAYKNALNCKQNNFGGMIVLFGAAYLDYPTRQLASVYLSVGNFDEAWPYIQKLKELNHPEFEAFQKSYIQARDICQIRSGLTKSTDILITCPPQAAVVGWDDNMLKEKGLGGSETAAVEVARILHKKTGRKVKIFHPRESYLKSESGVEYIPVQELAGYLRNVEPYVHIAWRHAIRLTQAKSYVWCHDLFIPDSSKLDQYDKLICLSQFHKDYVYEMGAVPNEKVVVFDNGIDPSLYEKHLLAAVDKNPLKVFFSSSPDRGLDRAIEIVEIARQKSGLDIELHVFYGMDNLRKYGLGDLADRLENMMSKYSWLKYHGNVDKVSLSKHMMSSSVWLYPANFIETYCITAIEALCSGVYPLVRNMGALPNTLSRAEGMCTILNIDAESEQNREVWADELIDIIVKEKWKSVSVNPHDYSWERVADQFIKEMDL